MTYFAITKYYDETINYMHGELDHWAQSHTFINNDVRVNRFENRDDAEKALALVTAYNPAVGYDIATINGDITAPRPHDMKHMQCSLKVI